MCGVLGEDVSGVVLVQRHGTTAVEVVGGVADRAAGIACARDTRFQVCSVSKQFAAVATLLLADQGRLSLDDPVTRWFGDGTPGWRAITPHHLLTHTSGLGHWPDYPDLDLYQPVPPERELELFQRGPLLSRPGDSWRYSSPGYVLLGWIVQAVSGQPYADFLADRIFAPLGLASTSAGDPPGGPGLARGYRAGETARSFDLGAVHVGAGDVWSTAGDLIRWDDALAAGELLSPDRRREMLTAHATVGGGPAQDEGWTADGFGYGWFIGRAAGRRAYFHPGDNPGYQALNAWLPDDGIRLAVLLNEETVDLGRLLAEVLPQAGSSGA
jgi:CubicO group peptidase (beta-lactamase class C family)